MIYLLREHDAVVLAPRSSRARCNRLRRCQRDHPPGDGAPPGSRITSSTPSSAEDLAAVEVEPRGRSRLDARERRRHAQVGGIGVARRGVDPVLAGRERELVGPACVGHGASALRVPAPAFSGTAITAVPTVAVRRPGSRARPGPRPLGARSPRGPWTRARRTPARPERHAVLARDELGGHLDALDAVAPLEVAPRLQGSGGSPSRGPRRGCVRPRAAGRARRRRRPRSVDAGERDVEREGLAGGERHRAAGRAPPDRGRARVVLAGREQGDPVPSLLARDGARGDAPVSWRTSVPPRRAPAGPSARRSPRPQGARASEHQRDPSVVAPACTVTGPAPAAPSRGGGEPVGARRAASV